MTSAFVGHLFAAVVMAQGLDLIKNEPNLEKRAGRATDHATKLVGQARHAYQQGQLKDAVAALNELAEAVELAEKWLKETGKNASRSPKHFKRAELASRGIVKRLDSFIHDMAIDDSEAAEKARARVRKVQEDLLAAIMGGGRKRK